jgi:hypothetical protein
MQHRDAYLSEIKKLGLWEEGGKVIGELLKCIYRDRKCLLRLSQMNVAFERGPLASSMAKEQKSMRRQVHSGMIGVKKVFRRIWILV